MTHMTQHIPTRITRKEYMVILHVQQNGIKMFNPNFRYTNKIVRLLTKISASREIILNSPLIPKWELTLRREAIIRSAHSSTRIDDYYDSDRPAYYRALQSVDQKTLDLTDWLEYFAEGVAVSIDAVKERVVRLSSERLRKAKRGQIALTERQMQMVEFINITGKITSGDIQRMFKISRQAAHKEIKTLMELGVIKSQGVGRATYYVLD